nr:hypothetical protein [Tanacetum cinerariifolium]GFA32511.1 hypothetical protein [Tanacetum cinerariifolium]
MKKSVVLSKDGKPMMAARREQFDANKGDTSLDESGAAKRDTKDNTLEVSAYVSQPLVEYVNEVHNDVDQVKSTGWEDVEDNRVKSFANVVHGNTTTKTFPQVYGNTTNMKPVTKTFVSMLNNAAAKKVVKLAKMTPSEVVLGAHVAILMAAIEEDGMERVLENGPWLIRLVSLILNAWKQNSKLKKDDITFVPIWVKIHNVPIVAYSEIGLSLITSTLGKPIMLDGYTSNVCINSWGCNSYVRALIEVSAKTTLLDSIVVAIALPNGMGHSMETIGIEYKWQPLRCETCKIFDHNDDQCPKKVVVTNSEEKLDDGLWKLNVKARREQIPSTNGSQPNEHTNAPSQPTDPRGKKALIEDDFSFVSIRNSVQSLTEDDKMIDANDRFWSISSVHGTVEEDDSKEVVEVFTEKATDTSKHN